MYQQIETESAIIMESNSIVTPVASLRDECGGICHIIVDDGCYVLCIENEDGFCKPTSHIFKEAFKILRTLPLSVAHIEGK